MKVTKQPSSTGIPHAIISRHPPPAPPSSSATLIQELDHETLPQIPSGLLLALATVPDPRGAQGRIYVSHTVAGLQQ